MRTARSLSGAGAATRCGVVKAVVSEGARKDLEWRGPAAPSRRALVPSCCRASVLRRGLACSASGGISKAQHGVEVGGSFSSCTRLGTVGSRPSRYCESVSAWPGLRLSCSAIMSRCRRLIPSSDCTLSYPLSAKAAAYCPSPSCDSIWLTSLIASVAAAGGANSRGKLSTATLHSPTRARCSAASAPGCVGERNTSPSKGSSRAPQALASRACSSGAEVQKEGLERKRPASRRSGVSRRRTHRPRPLRFFVENARSSPSIPRQ
mmetsp:Transcript_22271/g.51259  ORF Transcript_22271/g.51259 Transcript_22271/m.51259 type:complete len:264 (+) Transcript_22271:1080-1871(+)